MPLDGSMPNVQIICNGLSGREYSANQNAPFIDKAGVGYDYHCDEVMPMRSWHDQALFSPFVSKEDSFVEHDQT